GLVQNFVGAGETWLWLPPAIAAKPRRPAATSALPFPEIATPRSPDILPWRRRRHESAVAIGAEGSSGQRALLAPPRTGCTVASARRRRPEKDRSRVPPLPEYTGSPGSDAKGSSGTGSHNSLVFMSHMDSDRNCNSSKNSKQLEQM
ncbi:hypothetical protein EJB05_46438, partial [Eragrostis curvula]